MLAFFKTLIPDLKSMDQHRWHYNYSSIKWLLKTILNGLFFHVKLM